MLPLVEIEFHCDTVYISASTKKKPQIVPKDNQTSMRPDAHIFGARSRPLVAVEVFPSTVFCVLQSGDQVRLL